MDYILSRPIYAYTYTLNLMYYDNGTICEELLFSSDIWAGYIWQA